MARTYADADYVLRWLEQTNAPENIIALQHRVVSFHLGRGGRPVREVADARLVSRTNVGRDDLRSSNPSSLSLLGWVPQVPDGDLRTLHHALRLVAKYPGMSETEKREFIRLADLCWDEHARRVSAKMLSERANRV